MTAEEREICIYLKGYPGQFVAGREISRRAGGKWRHRDNPGWATPVLEKLVEQGFVESDATGHYRLVRKMFVEKKKKYFISPKIQKILEDSGKFTHIIDAEDDLPGNQ